MTTNQATIASDNLSADLVDADIHAESTTTAESAATPEGTATAGPSNDAGRARREARADEVAEAASEIVGAAVDIGRAWARYGLQIGKLALETHARTMGNLAVAVGQAARAVDAVAGEDAVAADPKV